MADNSSLDGGTTQSASPDLAAGTTSNDYYDVTISNIPIVIGKKYRAQFWYYYHNDDPKITDPVRGNSSASIYIDAPLPDYTKAVTNIVLTPGYKNYQVKFDITSFPGFVDLVIYESATGAFAGEEHVVYSGTSNQATILTSDLAPRYVKVIARDQWLHFASATAGPVTPKNPDPDTSTPPAPPSDATATGSIDPNDKSGFGGLFTASWTASTDTNVGGYVIRWTPDDPSKITNPNWEYGQVDGRLSTSFTFTGLLLNTTYYYQITAKSPYNALSWVASQVQTIPAIVDSTAGGAWSRIKSYISIGGATEDLFKIGTGIIQKINNSTTTTPSYTYDTTINNGIILNRSTTNVGNNYWLNTGKFRVGNETSFLFWDGSDIYTTGKINATGGSFTGDVQLNGGSLYAGTLPNSGQRIRLNSSGIFAYNSGGTQTFSVDTAGQLTATSGSIAGWVMDSTTLSKNGAKLDSAGTISLGTTAAASVYLSAADATYRLWVGNNNGQYASFSVDSAGVLRATGAIISGNITIGSGTTYDAITSAQSTANSAQTTANSASSAAAAASTAASSASTKADNATTAATNAFNKANAALPASSFNRAAIVQYINSTTSNPTNTTSIDGGTIITGTISANAVVADFISAFSIDATKITAGTLTGQTLSGGTISGGSISIGSTGSDFLHTNYPRTTPDGYYTVTGLGVNAISMISSSTAGVGSHWYPYLEAANDLGLSSYRWRNVRYYGALTTTSDRRIKKDISESDLGLDFIKDLKPVKYKKIYNTNIPKINNNGEIEIDEDGNRIIDHVKTTEGDRFHYGFIAQEVKESLDKFKVGDQFAGWLLDDLNDPDSRQGLAYDDFISPLTKAVQELANMVESLQQEVSELKGK